MTQHDDAVRFRHMLEHAQEVVDLAGGESRNGLRSNRVLELALTRLIEITGEAAARVSPAGKTRCPQIPWRRSSAWAIGWFMAMTQRTWAFCGTSYKSIIRR